MVTYSPLNQNGAGPVRAELGVGDVRAGGSESSRAFGSHHRRGLTSSRATLSDTTSETAVGIAGSCECGGGEESLDEESGGDDHVGWMSRRE